MDPNSIAHASAVMSQAFAMKAENQSLEAGTAVLKGAIQMEEQMAADLLAMMGVGQNLNLLA